MAPFPKIAPPLAFMVGRLPAPPARLGLTLLSRRVAIRHSGIVERLGAHAEKSFALDPTDLPLVLVLTVPDGRPHVAIARDAVGVDCRIAGRLSALLALVHGRADGDALFFSRDLVVEGDVAAALALRNAVDDAELDLMEELAGLVPPLAGPIGAATRLAEQLTGVALRRHEEYGEREMW